MMEQRGLVPEVGGFFQGTTASRARPCALLSRKPRSARSSVCTTASPA
jgi:hypothetical protein